VGVWVGGGVVGGGVVVFYLGWVCGGGGSWVYGEGGEGLFVCAEGLLQTIAGAPTPVHSRGKNKSEDAEWKTSQSFNASSKGTILILPRTQARRPFPKSKVNG